MTLMKRLLASLLFTALVAAAQTAAISAFRTAPIEPQTQPPGWADAGKIQRGLAFSRRNAEFINRILGTTSLVSTYAARDILPVLIATGRLTNDYGQRLKETAEWMGSILQEAESTDEFWSRNYRKAVALGRLHLGVRQRVTGESLGWNAAERTPVSQQAYAFVLYTFAWQPLEAMVALKRLDLERNREEVEDYLHAWSVLGYAMGVAEPLLPRGVETTRRLVTAVREAQYFTAADGTPAGLNRLLRNQLELMAEGGDTKRAAAVLGQLLQLSPGLPEALGLGSDPGTALSVLPSTTGE